MAAVASTTAAGHGAGGAAATLPADFYWGGSTSAFQFEGGASEGGKGKSVYDVPLRSGAKFDTASDFYHHWREDIDLMAQMGFSAFRMYMIASSSVVGIPAMFGDLGISNVLVGIATIVISFAAAFVSTLLLAKSGVKVPSLKKTQKEA